MCWDEQQPWTSSSFLFVKNPRFEGHLHDFGQITQFSESVLSTYKEEKVASPVSWELWPLNDLLSKAWTLSQGLIDPGHVWIVISNTLKMVLLLETGINFSQKPRAHPDLYCACDLHLRKGSSRRDFYGVLLEEGVICSAQVPPAGLLCHFTLDVFPFSCY